MAKRAMFTGVDNVKSVFEQMYQPGYAYSVSYSERGDPCFQYFENDREKGIVEFDAYVDHLSEAGNDDLLHLRFHPIPKKSNDPYITKQSPVIVVTPIRVSEIGGNPVINGVGEVRDNTTTWRMFKAIETIEKLPDAQAAFEAKIMGLLEEEPLAPVKVDKNQQYLEMAIGALKEPNVIANIQGLIKMFFPAAVFQQPQPAISGVHEQQAMSEISQADQGQALEAYTEQQIDSLNQSLARLAAHCRLDTDLLLLANMAEQNPQEFNFLLSMLRK